MGEPFLEGKNLERLQESVRQLGASAEADRAGHEPSLKSRPSGDHPLRGRYLLRDTFFQEPYEAEVVEVSPEGRVKLRYPHGAEGWRDDMPKIVETLTAQAMEAETGKTEGLDPKDDSAVPQGMRPEYLRARREVLAEIRSIITDMENE